MISSEGNGVGELERNGEAVETVQQDGSETDSDSEPSDGGEGDEVRPAVSEAAEVQQSSGVEDSRGASKARTQRRGPDPVEFAELEPWPDPVDGAELLDGIERELKRFVVFGKWVAETLALWIVHTHAYQLRQVTTYMGIESPEKECGKSTLLTVLSQFVRRPAVSANISPAAFFRTIEELEPTLLIDEADTNLRGKDDMMGILNAGYTRSTAFVWRMSYEARVREDVWTRQARLREEAMARRVREGEALAVELRIREGSDEPRPVPVGEPEDERKSAGRVVRYSCWCPKAIAGIGRLPPTLASRCIVVQMHRKLEGEACERLNRLDATELKRKCVRFVADHEKEIASAEAVIPAGLSNRSADIWEPLLVLADLAGGRWPQLAREAAMGLTGRAAERSPIGSLLLDIRLAFEMGEVDRIFSRDLVTRLVQFGERPWQELSKGRPVTEIWLARQLGRYGIKSRPVRKGEVVAKGYLKDDFTEIFRRYIPRSEVEALKRELAV